MSIRYRLAAVLAGIVVPVLVGAGLVLAVLLPARVTAAQERGLDMAARSVGSAMAFECGALGYRAQIIALDVANGQQPKAVLADQRKGRSDADTYDVVQAKGQQYVAGNLDGADPTKAPARRCSETPAPIDRTRDGTPLLVEQATVATTEGQIVVTSVERITPAWVTAAKNVAAMAPTHVSLYCTTGRTDAGSSEPDAVWKEAKAQPGQPCDVRAGQDADAGSRYRLWALLALTAAVLVAVGLIVWLANELTSPIVALSDAARRATAGDRTVRLGMERRDEIGELGRDFDAMVEELDGLITQAEHGRDSLRDTSRRLGDVLRRTHDLDGMLTALCALAETTAGAECASVWMTEPTGLRIRTVHPIGSVRADAKRLTGPGPLPITASESRATEVRDDASGDPSSALGGRMVALPLVSGDKVLGVLLAERSAAAAPFDADEIERLELAIGSAGAAVDNALLHRAAQRQSVVDPLTGVGNMRHLTTTLGREIERGKRFDRHVAVMIVDVDRFRQLNDELGPSVGDGVLRALAAELSEHVRAVDTVARYGGEEFAVVCPELGPDNAQRAAQRLVDMVRGATLDVLGVQVRLTVSVGIACYPTHGMTALELITAADGAMAQAKKLGRDRAVTAGLL